MKKKILILGFILAIFASGIFVVKLLLTNNDVDDGFSDLSQVKHEQMLSMMLEQTAGAGDYSLETRTSWPTQEEGYVFNKKLSKCENGSKLKWDDENNLVVMEGVSSDKCYAYFDKYNSITINSSSVTVSGNSVIITIDASAGDGSISKYYYSKDNGLSYVDSTSNIYTFTGLITGDYTIKYYVEDSNGKTSEVITKQLSVTSVTLATWVKSQYTGTQGENNLYYHDSTLENGARDNSYRYAGAHDEVNNFVCFGSDEETCPDDNLYRIIGVFENQVKLIKWDYANNDLLGTDGDYYSEDTYSAGKNSFYKGSKTIINKYYWNSDGTNTWSTSKLNTINLNENYANNTESIWTNKVADTIWMVGGNTYENVASETSHNAYENEYLWPTRTVTYTNKIGLMYTSDYGFAAAPSAWTKTLGSYNSSSITSVNWMYMGLVEWTVVRHTLYSDDVFIVLSSGDISSCNNVGVGSAVAVRPVFYLNSDVTYVSGDGTKGNPIRLAD